MYEEFNLMPMGLTLFFGFETVSALQSKSVKRPSQNNEIKFPCGSHRFVSVTGTIVRISQRNVKHHFDGSDFDICKSIYSWKS